MNNFNKIQLLEFAASLGINTENMQDMTKRQIKETMSEVENLEDKAKVFIKVTKEEKKEQMNEKNITKEKEKKTEKKEASEVDNDIQKYYDEKNKKEEMKNINSMEEVLDFYIEKNTKTGDSTTEQKKLINKNIEDINKMKENKKIQSFYNKKNKGNK